MTTCHARTRWMAAVALAVVLLLTSCDPPGPVVAAWNIDELPVGRVLSAAHPGPVKDATGHHALTVGPGSNATITVVAGAPGHGSALQFPASGYVDLHAADPAGLSPGSRPIQVQVLLSTTAAKLDPLGNNVVQQGLYFQAQWKLEVDGGTAGCRFADGDIRTGGREVSVRSRVRIDDGAWWLVTCQKAATTASVVVQRFGSTNVEVTTVPSQVGSINSSNPVQVGSKAAPSDADQFHGRLDDISVRIG